MSYSLGALLLSSVFLLFFSRVWSQDLIIEAPANTTVPLGTNATFRCSASGLFVFWEIRGAMITSPSQVELLRNSSVFVPLSMQASSEVVIFATSSNNGTTLRCLVEVAPESMQILEDSALVNLLIFMNPSPPTNLMVILPDQGLGVTLSWMPGFALEGEEVAFNVTSLEVETGIEVETEADAPPLNLIPTPTSQESTCQRFRFTVNSRNLFGSSILPISIDTEIPTVPLSVNSADVDVNIVFLEAMPSLNISFDSLSPCDLFPVDVYSLAFSETSNDFGLPPQPEFGFSQPISMEFADRFSRTVTAADSLLMAGRQYNLTISATNSAGTTLSSATISTTGLQSIVVETTSSSVVIFCFFADGATGLGCRVSIGLSDPEVDLTRMGGSDIAMATVPLPEGLTGLVTVAVTEILSDGNESAITRETTVEIPTPTPESTTSNVLVPSIVGTLGSILVISMVISCVVITVIAVRRKKTKKKATAVSAAGFPKQDSVQYDYAVVGASRQIDSGIKMSPANKTTIVGSAEYYVVNREPAPYEEFVPIDNEEETAIYANEKPVSNIDNEEETAIYANEKPVSNIDNEEEIYANEEFVPIAKRGGIQTAPNEAYACIAGEEVESGETYAISKIGSPLDDEEYI